MENEKKVSSQGRVLRPRRSAAGNGDSPRTTGFSRDGERRSYGEHRGGEHRSYSRDGEHRSYRSFGGHSGDGERRPYGERRSFHHDGESGNGEHRSYGEHRGGERRPYNRDGEHGSYRSYGEGRPADGRRQFGDHSGNGERRPYGERRSFHHDGEFGNGERRSFSDERRSGEGRGYGERRSFGDRRPSGSRQGGFNRGGRKPYGRAEASFDEREGYGISRMLSRKPQVDGAAYSDNDSARPETPEEVRLNKFIANSGMCSRREADTYIQAGVVTVNGEVVTELGTKVNVLTDDVRFNGERLKGEAKVYVVMNKPKGYVTTASDPHAERTVMDLLKGCTGRVFPVGRLDKATTGVLMFTNDGEMAERLTHPSYDKKKIYQVLLDHELTQEDYDRILKGVTLSDGEVAADELEYIDEHDHRKLGIEIHSGKNRIVRRIFESLGYDVKALDRVYFAGLTKKGLQKGEWRYLTEGEVNILKMGAYV